MERQAQKLEAQEKSERARIKAVSIFLVYLCSGS
jgi:hypothetical protein